jgi:hypothetical protein
VNGSTTPLVVQPGATVTVGPVVKVNGSSAPITVSPGAIVTVQVLEGPGLPRDWVTKHETGAPNNIHSNDWQYLNGSQVPPTTGQASATLTFTMPTNPGPYHFRFFKNDTYTLLTTSPIVTVSGVPLTPTPTPLPTSTPTVTPTPAATPTPTATATPGGPTLTVNGSSAPVGVQPGATVTVQVAGGPGLIRDWVARHEVAAANNVHANDWKYLNGLQTAPATGRTSATLTFAMPTTPGDYNLRFFRNDTYTLLAVSPTIHVGAVVTVNGSTVPVTVAAGATVTVQVSNGPAQRADWVAKALSTAANNVHFADWSYLNGTQTPPANGQAAATLTFTMPTASGTYNFRFFRNDTYTLLATSPTVTVP